MVGSAERFLSYNETNVMKHLLAIEAHLRELGSNYKGEHASCVVKHLLQLEEQCEEGISHASELGLDRKVEIFREIHSQIPALRKSLEEGANPNDLIRKVREIRRKAEGLNPNFNLEQCKACGNIEEVLAKLKIPRTTIAELEEETAHRILESLSAKYNVPKPKLTLLDKCPTEPTGFGEFQVRNGEPEIVLCRGSADVHKLLHEVKHYLDYLAGKPLSEEEAEQFALEEVAKPIYVEASHSRDGEKMVAWREIGVIYGGQHIAKGLERGFEEIDRMTGKLAAPVEQRPSTWLNIGLGVGLPLIAVFARIRDPWDKLLVLMGGHFSTKIWDYVEEYMAAKGGAAAAYVPASAAPTVTAPAVAAPPTATATATPSGQAF